MSNNPWKSTFGVRRETALGLRPTPRTKASCRAVSSQRLVPRPGQPSSRAQPILLESVQAAITDPHKARARVQELQVA
jgi:hypothetical protein